MKSFIRNSVVTAVLMATLSGVGHAAYLPPSFHDFGQASDSQYPGRIIKIKPDTRSIGVYRLETVKFVDEQTGKSFTWKFDTLHAGNFPLRDIAPAGTLGDQAVQAYVWDSPSNDSQP
ncbi:MAG: hypothetical protein JWN94_551 [Betaproteobacteria bacterium]|nr:hypothetical protein [Betaproteobacteria bacterium]